MFKANPGKGLPKRTFKDKLTIGSGADQINLYYFGPGAHRRRRVRRVRRRMRVMHAGDTFAGQGPADHGQDNGGSGVQYAATIRKAVDGVKNVDTIINGHTPAQTTPADMREFADFVQRFRRARAGREESRQDRRRGHQGMDRPGEVQGLRRAGCRHRPQPGRR